MRDLATIPDLPPPELRYRHRVSVLEALRELWRSKELALTLTERGIRARYKQELLGIGWAILTPVVYMIVFKFFFTRVATVDTQGVPYVLFSYVALLPWTFFSTSIGGASTSLVANMTLLNKVYCPREVFPISQVATAAFDTSMATLVLVVLFAVNTVLPKWTTIYVPLLLAVQIAFTVGLGMATAALVVYFRDLRRIIPVLLQVGLFATPIGYGIDKYPAGWLNVIALVNPLVGLIDGYRRAVLYGQAPDWTLVGLGTITSFVVLAVGFVLFKRLEPGIADVA